MIKEILFSILLLLVVTTSSIYFNSRREALRQLDQLKVLNTIALDHELKYQHGPLLSKIKHHDLANLPNPKSLHKSVFCDVALQERTITFDDDANTFNINLEDEHYYGHYKVLGEIIIFMFSEAHKMAFLKIMEFSEQGEILTLSHRGLFSVKACS